MQTMLPRSRMFCRLLSVLLLSLTCIYSNAQAGDHRVTISGSAITLKSVFKAIKKQTGFAVMYNTSITMLNQEDKVSVSFKDTPLDEVLAYLLKGKNLGWTYNDDVVIIHKKPVEAPQKNEVDSTVTPALLSGRVTDAAGSPLPGVTVQVKGTSQGTTTDVDGKFTLPKVKIGEELVFSSVGFDTRTVTVKGKSVLTQMNMLVNALDETVVVAYGETTRRLSTGNIASVKAKDIEKQPVTNPLLALQGRVPGLFIEQATGVPGTAVTVRIQGKNSLERGSDPLYVIDGVPYISQMLVGNASIQGRSEDGGGTGNPLSYINPADIESIEVLKDADATSIYGSRAAAGAILITTKKGKAGKTQVDVNFQQGWSRVGHFLNLLNTPEYLAMRREAKKNDEQGIRATDYDINGEWDTTKNTDWQKELIGNTAQYTNARLSVSGGTNNTAFLLSFGYNRQTTVFPGDLSSQQATAHLNINHASINGRFKLQAGMQYMLDRSRLINIDLTRLALNLVPNAPALYKDGGLNWATDQNGVSTWTNPLDQTLTKYKNHVNNLVTNGVISYEIWPGLSVKSNLGYTNMTRNEVSLHPLLSFAPENRPFTQRFSTFGNDLMTSWNIEPQITYNKKYGRATVEALLGSTFLRNEARQQNYSASGFNSDLLLEDITAAASLSATSTVQNIYKYNALFARLNFNWDNKYIVNLSARRDGSSRFGSNNLFHSFASVGAAWLFSNESFAQQLTPFLSFGKLRGSYGSTGNDQIGDYQFMNLYYSRFLAMPYQGNTSLFTAELPNPYLQWEETRKLQVGLETGFLNDRILLNLTYYRNRSSNQLQSYALPAITGTRYIAANFPATIQNSGWEFLFTTINFKRDHFSWSSSVNLTIPRNKLIAYKELEKSSYSDIYIIGQPFTIAQVYRATGVDPTTGLYIFLDQHGAKTSSPVYPDDATKLINRTSKYYGGIQNSLSYKGFFLDFLFQFVHQEDIGYRLGNRPGSFRRGIGNQPISVLDRWQKPGDQSPIQRFSASYPFEVSSVYSFARQSDAAYEDASYIRLKNLSFSWQLPGSLLQKLHIYYAKAFVQGQNLITLTNYSGLDPETTSVTSLPPLRVFTLGIQITL